MDTRDTPSEGPLTIADFAPNSERYTPTEPAQEAAPEVASEEITEEVEADVPEEGEAVAEPETGEESDVEPDAPDGEPQHLSLDEYGDLTVPVKVNGVEQRVSLAEAAKGYQLQEDYSRKMNAFAMDKKAQEAEISDRVAQLEAREQAFNQRLAQTEGQEPDWVALAEDDPIGAMQEQLRWNADKAKREEAQRAVAEYQQKKQRAFQAETAEIAVTLRPEWADSSKFEEGSDNRRNVAFSYGFSEGEYNGSFDYRIAAMLQDLAEYKARQAMSTPVAKKLSKAPKVLKPSAPKGRETVQAEAEKARKRKFGKPFSLSDISR